LHVHIYVKMQNFIELPPISTQLYHIKYNRLVNVYISPEKREKITISVQQYDRSPQNLAR